MANMTTQEILQGIKDWAAPKVIYDISAAHNNTKYADLSDALGTNGGNIPQEYRKGGITVRYVRTSDNKYVQYRLIADEFTTDTTQWAIADEGVYVENPEFVYVKTDNEGKILWAIRTDGDIFYGAGVPSQVVNYINEKIAELSLDEYEDIVAFLNDLEKGDKTLQNLLDEKVDKKEGKSLIDAEYANGVHYIENPEFAEVKVDSEDRILEATRLDGTKLFGAGIEVNSNAKITGDLSFNGADVTVIENPEFVGVWLDAENKVLFGVQTDGNFLFGCGVPNQIKEYIEQKIEELSLDEYENIVSFLSDYLGSDTTLKAMIDGINAAIEDKLDKEDLDPDALNSVQAVENPEFIEVELDAENKMLGGRKTDGTKFENNDVELNGNVTVGGYLEVDGVVTKNIEDPEGRLEISTDSEDKIICYRKADGTLVENVGIDSHKITTDSLNLSENGMTEFQQALKDAGFQPGGGGDWSDREVIELPEPASYVLLNLIVEKLPNRDSETINGYAEYYDKKGNYFKIPCSLELQGQSSRVYAVTGGKGNYTLDLSKDVKFGEWVPQDSFHLKGGANDITSSRLPVSYKWAYLVMNHLNAKPNRVLFKDSSITANSASGDFITDWPSGARCLPDGFPCEIYVNEEYWGLYSWQLKKHRKNYSMDKKDYTSFFIDADDIMTSDYTTGIWNEGPKRWWDRFEIKNPKDMILVDGTDYDEKGELISPLISHFDSVNWGYTNDYSIEQPSSGIWNAETNYNADDECWCYDEETEWWRKFKALQANQNAKPISFETNTIYNSSNKKHKGSASTKAIIQSFAKKYLEVKKLIDDGDIAEAKDKYNEYFDYNASMLVYIFNCLLNNHDSIKKNTLWGTYKNGKIAPFLWDLDNTYGAGLSKASNPSIVLWERQYASYSSSNWPLGLFWALYEDDIKKTYISLRKANIISIETFHDIIFSQWANRIGEDAYKRNIKKWPETASYRENLTNTEYWEERPELTVTHGEWDETTQYATGDVVTLKYYPGYNSVMKYRAKQSSVGVCPVTGFYENYPQVGGMYDSPKRMEKWVKGQILLCDAKCDYTEILSADFTIYDAGSNHTISCSGMNLTDSDKLVMINTDKRPKVDDVYIKGHITRHEESGVSIYSISSGYETLEDSSKTYLSVEEAIGSASSQQADVPSEDEYYIYAKAKDINFFYKQN